MAQDLFLKISGIDGESEDVAHKGEIEVLSFGWKAHQESMMHAGSGGGAGKATVDDLEFEHYVDRSSPNLMKYCLTGKHVQNAVLTVRKAGGNPLEYLRFTFSDVIVTSVNPFGSNADNLRVRERVKISFAKVKQEYALQNAQGGNGGPLLRLTTSKPIRNLSLISRNSFRYVSGRRQATSEKLDLIN